MSSGTRRGLRSPDLAGYPPSVPALRLPLPAEARLRRAFRTRRVPRSPRSLPLSSPRTPPPRDPEAPEEDAPRVVPLEPAEHLDLGHCVVAEVGSSRRGAATISPPPRPECPLPRFVGHRVDQMNSGDAAPHDLLRPSDEFRHLKGSHLPRTPGGGQGQERNRQDPADETHAAPAVANDGGSQPAGRLARAASTCARPGGRGCARGLRGRSRCRRTRGRARAAFRRGRRRWSACTSSPRR